MALYLNGNKIVGGGGGGSASDTTFDDTNVSYEAGDVQEAFEKVTKSLTYDEYEALTEEEKNNGTIYLITDVNGDGQSFQPVIRSLEEREVGVWTDGKPLYEKTIYNAGGTNGVWSFTHNISNLERIIGANGGCIVHGYSDYSQISWQTLPRTSPDNANIGIVGISDTYVSMYVNDAFGNRVTDIYITLRYTKTTDTAGSGTWTPQGVPAVHYSTDEQVIGTWIDGSTLYEKTWEFSTPISVSQTNWTNTTIPISGIDKIVSVENVTSGGSNVELYATKGTTYIQVLTGRNQYGTECSFLTLRYTKSST